MGWFRVKPGGLTTTGLHYTSNPIKVMDKGRCGLEIYRRILEIRPQPKAIIVSGFAKTDRVGAAQELGAGEYIKKPYVIEKLVIVVRKELDRKETPETSPV
jgi:DNA-binding NtrC family response regulator